MGVYELYSKERKRYSLKKRLLCFFLIGSLGVIGLFCLHIYYTQLTSNFEIAPFAFFRRGDKLPLDSILSSDIRIPKLLRSKNGDCPYSYYQRNEDKYRAFIVTGNVSRLKNIFHTEDGQRCTVGDKENLLSDDGIQAILAPTQDDSIAVLMMVAPKTKQNY